MAAARKAPDLWQWEDRTTEAVARWPLEHPWGPLVEARLTPVYSVMRFSRETERGTVEHLAIRRHDGGAHIPWADKQRIKNDVTGRERVAVEVFPAESELVNSANMFHVWVLPSGAGLPFSIGRAQ